MVKFCENTTNRSYSVNGQGQQNTTLHFFFLCIRKLQLVTQAINKTLNLKTTLLPCMYKRHHLLNAIPSYKLIRNQ